MKRIHVYDLDGVLVDSSHRYQNKPDGSIDLDHWIANRHRVRDDKLLPLARQYKKDCANPLVYVIICTAREYAHADVEFIADCLGMPDKLIMRPVGNQEHDATLKRRELSRLFNLRQFQNRIKKFWDDNAKNVDAVASLGVKCFHVKSKQGH